VIDHFQYDVAAGTGAWAEVFEHQDPAAEQKAQPGTVEPDRQPHQRAAAQQ
jgi:hypothetical protein